MKKELTALVFLLILFLLMWSTSRAQTKYISEWDFVRITKDTTFEQLEPKLSFLETPTGKKYKVTVKIEPVALVTTIREDFIFSGSWEKPENTYDPFLNQNCVWSLQVGASVAINFTGTKIEMSTTTDKHHGILDVYVDGILNKVDLYSPTRQNFQIVFSKELSPGAHSIVARVSGTKNPLSTGTYGIVDFFRVTQ